MNDRRESLSRRDFLKGSAAALAALSTGLVGSARADEVGGPINCAVIGTGGQGMQLIRRVLRIPGVNVVAVCDIYPPHLKEALRTARRARGYEDYRWMLERKDIQAVIIATPLYLHAPMAIDSMQAGKHVFCEKMMAYSIEQGKAMVRTARDTGKVLEVGYPARYYPTARHSKKLIDEGLLGRVTHIRTAWNRNGSWRRAVPDPKYERLLNWRLYREYSQGLTAELISHQVNQINWFLEALPTSVMGVGGIDYWQDGREVYDNVNIIFEYPRGIKVFCQSITSNQYDGAQIQYMGDKGTLVAMGEGRDKTLYYREPGVQVPAWGETAAKEKILGRELILLDTDVTTKVREQSPEGEEITAYEKTKDATLLELEDFFTCVREGKRPDCDGQEGLETSVCCLMANKAMATGKKLKYTSDMFKA